MKLTEIARAIQSRRADKLVLIAIEGYGGSGKTTFANQLATLSFEN